MHSFQKGFGFTGPRSTEMHSFQKGVGFTGHDIKRLQNTHKVNLVWEEGSTPPNTPGWEGPGLVEELRSYGTENYSSCSELSKSAIIEADELVKSYNSFKTEGFRAKGIGWNEGGLLYTFEDESHEKPKSFRLSRGPLHP